MGTLTVRHLYEKTGGEEFGAILGGDRALKLGRHYRTLALASRASRGGVGDDPCPEPQRKDSEEQPDIRRLSQDAFDVRRVDRPLAANRPDDPNRENHERHHPDPERKVDRHTGGRVPAKTGPRLTDIQAREAHVHGYRFGDPYAGLKDLKARD